MNLEYRINESYDRLTANDREVLNRILRNKAQSAGMNSTELAAFCHVSRTTLIRLFKKLGIGGFAEFRLLLKERAGMQELARLDMEEIISNYHRMVDGLREYDYSVILEAIHEAGTIYLYGTGNEQKAIGEEFKRIFLMFGKCCIDLFDYGEVEYASRYFKSEICLWPSHCRESKTAYRYCVLSVQEIKPCPLPAGPIIPWPGCAGTISMPEPE